jgi:hypothetical protein
MDLWNSRYLNRVTKNNVPIYPTGTGATIEGSDILKLNQYLAPQKKRTLNQYVPMVSVDPLRFRTDEQEIARVQLDGSQRILYPFASNKIEDIFPPDPYRVNITGNPSKFGGMTHPIAHRNTGAIDLESTDFINWKEGVDMSMAPGEGGASDYLSRALHAPPRDGLDSYASRYEDLPSGALEYYEDKKQRYKNKRQLLYRDPITGGRKFLNLPEFPNSIAYLQAQDEQNRKRNATMMEAEIQEMDDGADGYNNINEVAYQSRDDLTDAYENESFYEEPGQNTTIVQQGAQYLTPEQARLLDTFDSFTAEPTFEEMNEFGKERVFYLRRSGDLGVQLLDDRILEYMANLGNNTNYSSSSKDEVNTEIQNNILDIYQKTIEEATDLFANTIDPDVPRKIRRDLIYNYRTSLRYYSQSLANDSDSLTNYVVRKDNLSTDTTKSQFVSDGNALTPIKDAPAGYGQGGLLNTDDNAIDPNVRMTSSSNDTGINGNFTDPSTKLGVTDYSIQSTKVLEANITDLSKKTSPPRQSPASFTSPKNISPINRTPTSTERLVAKGTSTPEVFIEKVKSASKQNQLPYELPPVKDPYVTVQGKGVLNNKSKNQIRNSSRLNR